MLQNSPAKAGRNDACPCGSGKKYKHCCLNKSAESPETLWARVRDGHSHLAEELMEFGCQKFGPFLEDAWQDFHVKFECEPFDPESPEIGVFFHYFLCRWNPNLIGDDENDPPGAGLIAQRFLRRRAGKITPLERQLVEQYIAQPMSFYEVLSSRPQQGMLLREILTGQQVDVREHSASKQLQTGDIVFAQMSLLPGVATMGFSALLLIPPAHKAE